MTIIHVVYAVGGDYDSYHRDVIKGFFAKSDAEKFVEAKKIEQTTQNRLVPDFNKMLIERQKTHPWPLIPEDIRRIFNLRAKLRTKEEQKQLQAAQEQNRIEMEVWGRAAQEAQKKWLNEHGVEVGARVVDQLLHALECDAQNTHIFTSDDDFEVEEMEVV